MQNDKSPGISDVTIVVKTFRRPDCLRRAIDSLTAAWPTAHEIVVLDDSPPPLQARPDDRYRLILTEKDIGVSAGRNRLLRSVGTDLVAVFDDDFVVTSAACLNLLAEVVRQGICEIVAGAVRETAGYWNGGWIYRRQGTVLKKVHAAHSRSEVVIDSATVELFRVDQVNNAFVGNANFVRDIGWDPSLKLREHDDFALRSSAAGRIVYTPQAQVEHHTSDPPGYREIREDTSAYHQRFLDKWQLTQVQKEADWWLHSPEVPRPRIS